MICNYYSNYIEVEHLSRKKKQNTKAVTKALKIMHARYRVPDTVITDNGSQFASKSSPSLWEHGVFCIQHYPQSNGKAENAVKTIKHMFVKYQESGRSEFQALLDTPTEGTSPAQCFFGRQCRTLPPPSCSQHTPQTRMWSMTKTTKETADLL